MSENQDKLNSLLSASTQKIDNQSMSNDARRFKVCIFGRDELHPDGDRWRTPTP